MTIARGLQAASLSLALMSAFTLVNYSEAVRAEDHHTNPNSTGAPLTLVASPSGLSNAGDHVRLPLSQVCDGPSASGETIRNEVDRSYTPLRTVYQPSYQMLPGRHRATQRGRRGIWEQHIRIVTNGGQEVSRTLVSSGWYRAPQPHIIAYGVSPFEASRSFSRFSRPFTMSATEYDVYLGGAGSGRTCTGVRARRGIVAVDPRVIPLGTRLYVEGYGYCVAADTGGAIKGNRIDLCVESSREANRYGRHRVRVVIVP